MRLSSETVFQYLPIKKNLYYSLKYVGMILLVIAGGEATALSHVNDVGFWLVSSFFEIDENTTLKSCNGMETIVGITSLVVSLFFSIFT